MNSCIHLVRIYLIFFASLSPLLAQAQTQQSKLAGPLVFCSSYFNDQVMIPPVILDGLVLGEWRTVLGTHHNQPYPYPNENTLSTHQIEINRAKEREEYGNANTLLFHLWDAGIEVEIKIYEVQPWKPLSSGKEKVLKGKVVGVDPFKNNRDSTFRFLEKGETDPDSATEIGTRWLREIKIGSQDKTTRSQFDRLQKAISRSQNPVVKKFLRTGKFDLRKLVPYSLALGYGDPFNYPQVKDFLFNLSRSHTPVRVTDDDGKASEGILIYQGDWQPDESILLPEHAKELTDAVYLRLVSEKSFDARRMDKSKQLEIVEEYYLQVDDDDSILFFPSNIKKIELLF